ncbi:MAG: hypothetical protein EZS28_001775 [Streblomastix strix]|uniref:Tail specific protease domain-containing protein n=1 Tax=Streblomastix strix TaxID=222440 RepID=A0A5J4X6A4_9EUKA|nr:MAG: hypothetical protein EZS28_001775 [Streblomastix strix]
MAFVVFLALTCLLSAQCNFKKNICESMTIGLRCLRSIPLSTQSTEFNSTISLLETYVQSYAFLDTSLNPNAGGNSYNQESIDLQQVLKDIRRETFNNTFDFYERIMVLFNSLKDPHTYFVPPCVKNLIYVLPYYFSLFPAADGSQTVKIHYQIDPAFNKYNNGSTILLNYDTEILHINIKGKTVYTPTGELNDGTYKAAEAIAIWADQGISSSRSSVTRQNLAATGDFSYRPANQYPVPEYLTVSVEYRRPNGAQAVAQLPFFVMPIGDIGYLEDECPVNNQNQNMDGGNDNDRFQYMSQVQDGVKVEDKISIYQRIQKWIEYRKTVKQNSNKKSNKSPESGNSQQIHKQIREIQMKQTKEIQERLHPKPFEGISRVSEIVQEPELTANTSQTNLQTNSKKQSKSNKKQSKPNKQSQQFLNEEEIGMFSVFNPNVGIIKIPSFYPQNRQSFVSRIGLALNLYTNKNNQFFADRLIIDVRSNPGGYVGLGAQTLRFMFPFSGHPIYPLADQLRSQLNSEISKIDTYLMQNKKDDAELLMNPEYMAPDQNFFTRGGRQRVTSLPNGTMSMHVDLTEKYTVFSGHMNPFVDWEKDWRMRRQPLYNPQDVIVLTDGICASTCSIFVKEIQQKHLARIVGVGVRDPRDPNARFDTGRASSASSTSSTTIQQLKNTPEFKPLMDLSNVPNDFYRKGTSFGFANSGLYGFTNETNDKLMEYEIIDPDFIYEYAPNIEEEPQTYQEYIDFYTNILNYEKSLVGNDQGQPKKCFSWEIDFVDAADNGNCKGCSRDDQHSVFGYPCTTRGVTDKDGRNIDGTSKVGQYRTNKCIFSHCKIGYYRKKVNVNGVMKDQCVPIPLGYKETTDEMIPDSSEDTFTDSDQCGDPCADLDVNTPSEQCPCPTDATELASDPRKDGICKCAIVNTTTPVNTCPCPTEQTKLDQDPRKDTLCKCAIITEQTPINTCPCPTNPTLLQQDPRANGLCKCAIITSTTPIDTCACPTNPTQLANDPRKDTLCKCAIITSTTSPDTCECPVIQSEIDKDPRKDGLCKCKTIFESTPIDTCACPTRSIDLDNDPRKDGLCKCAIITSTTPIDKCACPTDPTELAKDPRANGLCKCSIITESTPIDQCACPTVPSQLLNDPRKDGLCYCAILTDTTRVDRCPCPTVQTELDKDPRKDGLCKCALITSTTPIDRCICPVDQSEFDSDPRKDGLCKCKVIFESTPTETCACPSTLSQLDSDPRKDGLCKCSVITDTTPIDKCACPINPTELAKDPRANGLCKCALITESTPIDRCKCPTDKSEFDKDPRASGLCKCQVIFESTPTDTCPCPTDSIKMESDPRKDEQCKCAIITEETPIDRCACPTEISGLQQDPRKDTLCKCAIITEETQIDRCICPIEQSEFDNDPRKDGLCKCKVIFEQTPIDACACPTDPIELANDPRKDGLCKCAIITEQTPIDRCACPAIQSEFDNDPRANGLCKCKVIFESTPTETCACPSTLSQLDSDPRKDGSCKCAIITETTPKERCACLAELALDPRQYGICQPEAKFFEYYINKSSGSDRLDRGLSPSSPTRSIGYTIKTLVDSYQYRGSALLNVAADNYSENIEFKSPGHGINTFRIVGAPQDGNNESYPALTNVLRPGQGAIKIIGVGVHVQHFIFEYVPPVSLSEITTPMISISAGSLSDWKLIASGQRNEIPDHLVHSFTDCIFEGSSVDYNTKKSYGYTIGPLLSIIGARVALNDCLFTVKENIQLLKGIPSVILSAVYLYSDSGVNVTNCVFENLTQGKVISDVMLKDIGLPDLAGNEQSEIQRLNNLPPSLAVFAISDSYSDLKNLNSIGNYIDIRSTIFAQTKSDTARSGALLIDGFLLGNNIKSYQQVQNPSSTSQLPIVTLDKNIFNNTEGLNSAAVALGTGVQYGQITNNQFLLSESKSQNLILINFESSSQVAEAGGADQIIGEGNLYSPPKSDKAGSDVNGTSGLFRVEGKQDSSFDAVSKKVTVTPVEEESVVDRGEEKEEDPEPTKKTNVGIIFAIVFSIIVVIGMVILVLLGVMYFNVQQKKKEIAKRRKQYHLTTY